MDTKPLSPVPPLMVAAVVVVVAAALMAKRVAIVVVVVVAVVVTTASATTAESTRPSVWLSDRRLQSGHRRTKSKASRNEETSGNLQL
jgi:hypothetical protein